MATPYFLADPFTCSIANMRKGIRPISPTLRLAHPRSSMQSILDHGHQLGWNIL